jgi:peptide deformylase
MTPLEQAARNMVDAVKRSFEMGVNLPANIVNTAMQLDATLNEQAEHQPVDFYNPEISADLNRKIQSKGF